MMAYRVTATIEDDVCLATRYGSANEYVSESYIPGSALWGTLARFSGIRPGDPPDEGFRRVFYSGEVVFTCLYPQTEAGSRAMPVPRSSRVYKPAPGFKDDSSILFTLEPQAGESAPFLVPEGVRDWLFRGVPGKDVEDWQPLDGFYGGMLGQGATSATAPRKLIEAEVVFNGHTDRSTRAGVSRTGQLFGRLDLARGGNFVGAIVARTVEAQAALRAVLDRAGNLEGPLPVGRQPGHVRLDLNADAALEWAETPVELNDGGHVTVTVLSHAVLVDPWLRAVPLIPEETIAGLLGLEGDSVRLVRHFSALVPLHGWSAVYNRPREVDLGIARGSAFLYRVTWPATAEAAERVARLASLQSRGVGLRRAEGFGEIRVNDPFHRVFQAEAHS